jgi:hypothetical protein
MEDEVRGYGDTGTLVKEPASTYSFISTRKKAARLTVYVTLLINKLVCFTTESRKRTLWHLVP